MEPAHVEPREARAAPEHAVDVLLVDPELGRAARHRHAEVARHRARVDPQQHAGARAPLGGQAIELLELPLRLADDIAAAGLERALELEGTLRGAREAEAAGVVAGLDPALDLAGRGDVETIEVAAQRLEQSAVRVALDRVADLEAALQGVAHARDRARRRRRRDRRSRECRTRAPPAAAARASRAPARSPLRSGIPSGVSELEVDELVDRAQEDEDQRDADGVGADWMRRHGAAETARAPEQIASRTKRGHASRAAAQRRDQVGVLVRPRSRYCRGSSTCRTSRAHPESSARNG